MQTLTVKYRKGDAKILKKCRIENFQRVGFIEKGQVNRDIIWGIECTETRTVNEQQAPFYRSIIIKTFWIITWVTSKFNNTFIAAFCIFNFSIVEIIFTFFPVSSPFFVCWKYTCNSLWCYRVCSLELLTLPCRYQPNK